jgi:DNA polymerase-3 subunit epsilon
MQHRPLVFLDVETTGGSYDAARVTEIGALRVENYKVVKTFNQLINPEQLIPYFITRLTGISNEMVWQAPSFRSIADELELFLDGAIFIAHHVNFDYRFIKAEFKRINYVFNMDRACSVRLSRRLYPEHKSHALDRIIERLDLKVEHRHRAYDDAEVIWKFFSSELDKRGLYLFSDINKLITYTR